MMCLNQKKHFMIKEMIFEHLFYDNFCNNFFSHTHIIFYFISLLL